MVLVLVAVLWTALAPTEGVYIPPGPKYPCPPPQKDLLYPCKCLRGSDTGISLLCNNTNLASLSIALTNVAAIQAPIDSITIAEGKFSRLYGGLLYAVDIRILIIQDTPLLRIEPQTFLGVNRSLEEIHLLRTQLEAFPSEAFQNLGKLKILNIDGHNLTVLPVGSISGAVPQNLEQLRVSNGALSELPVDTLIGCKKLKRLDLHGNLLATLKKNQFKGLRSVESLDLSHNLLEKIDPSHLTDLSKVSSVNVSHNAIKELTRGAFARNTVLRSLNLSHNKLKKIDSNSFRGMRFIRRLYMSDNEIAEVGRDTFGAVSRIGTIDLARNKIKKIDYQMFSQLQYAEVIDVSDNFVTEIQKLSFKDLYLVHINLSHNAISTIEPGSFDNCANITKLDLSYNKISAIPNKAFDEITYATEFDLSYNNLTDLSKVPLGNMTGLKILNVSYNQLAVVPRNTFPKLYELHTIDLAHNAITEIYNGVFQPLLGLRHLNLSHNSMAEIRTSTFGPLPTLLFLDLSHNMLTEVARGSLARLSSLQGLTLAHNALTSVFQVPTALSSLDMSHNQLAGMPPRAWPSMNALLTLNLSDNWLEDALERGAFTNLLTLRSLDLSRNYITEPPWQSLQDASSLQYLYLQGNNLTRLGKGAFGKLPIVFELDLSLNQLTNVSERAFEGLLQLLTLNLSHNQIYHLPNGAFSGLVSLRTLDLSHNLIESLDNKTKGLLDDCLSLERVNLSHNKISFVTRKTFPSDPYQPYKLKEVDLSYNVMPSLSYDITFGTKNIEYLNLSHNMINEIRPNVLGNLSSIKILDLSFNEIPDISEPNVFVIPKSLKRMYLANNQLASLPIANLNKIQLLDLRNNQLEYYTEFTKMIKNGSQIYYAGNEVSCDCRLRPLRRWLIEDLPRTGSWREVVCSRPPGVAGRGLLQLAEEEMECSEADTLQNEDFNTTPDLKFRTLQRNPDGKISLSWYVTANEDIADFNLYVRGPLEQSETTLFKKSLSYSTRSAILTNFPTAQGTIELCVMAVDSSGHERDRHSLQCRNFSNTASSAHALAAHFSKSLLAVALLFCLAR